MKKRSGSSGNGDTEIINRLIKSGSKILSSKSGNFDQVKTYIDSAVMICEKKNIPVPSSLHLLLAEFHFKTGDFRSASEEGSIALKQSAAESEPIILAKSNIFFGMYYNRTGLYKESIEYFGNAISISKKEGLKGIIPICYFGQAEVFNNLGDLTAYHNKLQLMIESSVAEKDSSRAETAYLRLGTYFCGDSATSERRNYKKADSLLRTGLKIALVRNDTSVTASALANLGWNYYLNKTYDSSLVYYDRSFRYSAPGRLYSVSANSLGNVGTIYRDLGESERSIRYYKKAIDYAMVEKDLYSLRWIYEDMSKMYLRENDTSNAFRAYVLFKKFSDQYLKVSSVQGLADARTRYEADTHNKEMELLSLRLKNQRILNFGFAGFIILATAIGFLLWKGSRLKDKRRISEMNHKISEIRQANLRQQMNPHFVFNTLNSIQYYMYQHDNLATNNYLTKFSSLLRKILDNSQHTSIPLADELAALKLYLELETIRFKEKFEYSITIDEDIDPLMHKVPTMLIQPYVENSICHGLIPKEDKGFVNIDLKLKDDYILCTIEDNGIGRDASKDKGKQENCNHSSLGTQITKSRLDLINELYGTSLNTIYTDLKDESGVPTGTRVEIHIPIII